MKARLPSLLLIAFVSFAALSPFKIENRTAAPCTVTIAAPYLDESGPYDKMILDREEMPAATLFSGHPGHAPLSVNRIMHSIPAGQWEGFLRVTVTRVIETEPVTQTLLLLYTPGIDQFYNRTKRSSLRPQLQVRHCSPVYAPDGHIAPGSCEFAASTFDYRDGVDRLTIRTALPHAIYYPLTDKLVIHDAPGTPFVLNVEQTEERSPLAPPTGRPTTWSWRINPPLASVAVTAPEPGAAEPRPLSVRGARPPEYGSPTGDARPLSRHGWVTPGRPGSRGGFQTGRGRGRSSSGSAGHLPAMLLTLALPSEEEASDDSAVAGLNLHEEEADAARDPHAEAAS